MQPIVGLRKRQSSLPIENETTSSFPGGSSRVRRNPEFQYHHHHNLELKHGDVIIEWNNTTLSMTTKVIFSFVVFLLLLEEGRTWLTQDLPVEVGSAIDAVWIRDQQIAQEGMERHIPKHFFPMLDDDVNRVPSSVDEKMVLNNDTRERSRDTAETTTTKTTTTESDTSNWIDEPSVSEMDRRPRPLVIAGPSGVGKGTLINKLLQHYSVTTTTTTTTPNENEENGSDSAFFGFSVSHTTRKPRPGEEDGVHYHFTNREAMLAQIEENKFVEHAEVHGNLYGTSFEAVRAVTFSGRICIIDIDIQGVKTIKKSSLNPHFIFIAPPSMEELERRLRDRGTESEEDIQRRLGNAAKELEYGRKEGTFDQIIVNNDIDLAFSKLRDTVEQWYPQLIR